MKKVCPSCGWEYKKPSGASLEEIVRGEPTHLDTIDGIRGERKICPETGDFAKLNQVPTEEEIAALRSLLKHRANLDRTDNPHDQMMGRQKVKIEFKQIQESDDWHDPDFWEKIRKEANQVEA